MTGPQDGGKKQVAKCLNILGEQIIDLENLSDRYKYSQDSLDTVLFNKFIGNLSIWKYHIYFCFTLKFRIQNRKNSLGCL